MNSKHFKGAGIALFAAILCAFAAPADAGIEVESDDKAAESLKQLKSYYEKGHSSTREAGIAKSLIGHCPEIGVSSYPENIKYTEMTLNKRGIGADGFSFRVPEGKPAKWLLVFALPQESRRYTGGSTGRRVKVGELSPISGAKVPGPWPDDYSVYIADYSVGGKEKLTPGADYIMIHALPGGESFKAWGAAVKVPGLGGSSRLGSQALRVEIWKTLLGCSDANRQMQKFYKALAFDDIAGMKTLSDTKVIDIKAIWKLYGPQLAFYYVMRDDIPTIKYFISKGCSFDVGYEEDTSRSYSPTTGRVTPLQTAIGRGDVEMAQVFLKAGCKPEPKMVQSAAYSGKTNLLQQLIDIGLPFDEVNKYGGTPLSLACARGNIDVVRMLLKNGADVKKAGAQALEGAIRSRKFELTKLLLDNGVDAKSELPPWKPGGAPAPVIVTAAYPGDGRAGEFDIFKLLVERGADPRVAGRDGKTPMDIVKEGRYRGSDKIYEYLQTIIKE